MDFNPRSNILKILATVVALSLPFLTAASEFDPGNLIADQTFGNYQAYASSAGIQRFLEISGSVLANTSIDFLRKLKEPADIDLKNRLEDPNASLGRLRTAAELIYDVAQVSKINPQVILVTLQKEQSLIDGRFSDNVLQKRLDRSMGFACPDNSGCSDLFSGFYFQLFGNIDNEGNRYLGAARSLSKSFYTESGGARVGRGPIIDSAGNTYGGGAKVRTAKAGDNISVDNTQGPPNNAPATSQFVLKNAATAALYRYTPHVYNGNFNFWKFFSQWFKFSNGSLVKLTGSDTVYFIDNGQRRPVSGTVLSQRRLDVTTAMTLSPEEAQDYPEAKPLPPPEGTLLAPASGGRTYLVAGSQLHILSDFIAKLNKFDLSKTLFLPDTEVNSYEVGSPALPPENSLVRASSQPVVYIVQGAALRPISGFVFGQRKYSFANVTVAPDNEILALPKSTPLPPLDGTLAKTAGSPLVYYVALGQKFPVPGFVFKLRKFKFSDVVSLGADEIENLTTAQHLAPADGTLIKAKGDGAVYLVEASNLHWLSGFMFKQRGYKFKDVVEVSAAEMALIPTNSPVLLLDQTLIKIQGDGTVYILEEGNKLPITYTAFIGRKYKFSDVVELPADEASHYPTGNTVEK